MEEQLMLEALFELAEHIGDSDSYPISVSMFCLRHQLTFDDRTDIWRSLVYIANNYDLDNMELEDVVSKVQHDVPKTIDFNEHIMIGLIKVFAKDLIVELYPFSTTI